MGLGLEVTKLRLRLEYDGKSRRAKPEKFRTSYMRGKWTIMQKTRTRKERKKKDLEVAMKNENHQF